MAQRAPHPAGERGIGGTGGQPAEERWTAERLRIASRVNETFSKPPSPHRHCEEAKPTKQSRGRCERPLDCFAALAMTMLEILKRSRSREGNTKFDLIGVI